MTNYFYNKTVFLTRNRLNCLNRNYTKPVGMKWKCLKTSDQAYKTFLTKFSDLYNIYFFDKNN